MNLKIGDTSENGQVTIIDEDRLCYLVKSTSRGAEGIRTISKSLLSEYIEYYSKNPEVSANEIRKALCGKSNIDKFEYGYTATLLTLAKLHKEKFLSEYIQFKHLLEYYCAHLQYIVSKTNSIDGYDEYLKSYVEAGAFKKSGQGWKGDKIQRQIENWERYEAGVICINVYGSSFQGYATYLHWKGTGFNISANWDNDKIESLQCVQYDENSNGKGKWSPIDNTKFTLNELSLYDGKEPNENVKTLFDAFLLMLRSSTKKEDLINLSLQQIFYGAPGTGKSNTIKQEVEDKDRIHFRTTFHPDSDYSTFVGCYKPTMKLVPVRDGSGHEVSSATIEEKSRISYSFVPQAFTKAYCEAWNRLENNEPIFLIIEEINRGNCAQIFGDLFQLLDRKDDGSSDYPIDADEDLKKFLLNGTKEDGTPWLNNKDGIKDGKLCLPPNLHIWATMNTSDQSLFPIDSAFKRRWDWKYVPIDTKKENWTIKVNNNQYSWSSFLEIINEKILAKTQSEDKQLGFYFCKADNNIISAERFVGKVLFYIYNDVYKDFGFDDAFFKNGDEKLSFQGYYKPNGEINEDKVEALLKNLNIKIVTEENDDDIESDSENAGKKEHKETLVSVTLNGETIKSSTQFDTYLDTIKAIGTDKVGAHIESMKFKRYGCPLASTVQMDGIKNSEGEYSYVSAGQYHFVKGAKSYTLIRVLEELKNIMNLDLEIEYK